MRKDHAAGDKIECDLAFVPNQAAAELADGFISGTASTPGIDRHGHRVLAGAFTDSIKAKGLHGPGFPDGVKLLAFHDMDKVAGLIKKLDTISERLRIEAQLFQNVTYVKDLYEVSKQSGGLSFSVGFRLVKDGYRFLDEDEEEEEGYYLEISKADLLEVSVVAFPAQPEATMDFVKQLDNVAEFEKTLVAAGIAKGRNEAQKILRLCKNNLHLFSPPLKVAKPAHPLLDAHQYKAATDLTAKVRQLLGA